MSLYHIANKYKYNLLIIVYYKFNYSSTLLKSLRTPNNEMSNLRDYSLFDKV